MQDWEQEVWLCMPDHDQALSSYRDDLGQYAEEHDHELGVENIAYTWLSWEAQDQIRSMLHRRVDPWEIVCNHYLFST